MAPDVLPVLSFLGQSWFPPVRDPGSYLVWHSGDATRLCDVSRKGTLLSKQSLEEKYKIALPWFQYMQLDHMFRRHCLSSVLDRDTTWFEQLIQTSSSDSKGFVSGCYHLLRALLWKIPLLFQKAWHNDCTFDSFDDDWEAIWSSPLFKSRSLSIKIQFLDGISLLGRSVYTPHHLIHIVGRAVHK